MTQYNDVDATKTNIQISHNGVAAGADRFQSSYCSQNNLQTMPVKLGQRVASAFVRKRSE